LLLEFLLKTINIETEVEEKREILAKEKQFNVYETFRFFDRHSRGYVYAYDLL